MRKELEIQSKIKSRLKLIDSLGREENELKKLLMQEVLVLEWVLDVPYEKSSIMIEVNKIK